MKKGKFTRRMLGVCMAMAMSFAVAAQTPAYTIVDLNTGETIDIYYDTANWRTVNKATNQPVDFYVISYTNAATYDTVHGVTGLIANNLVKKNDEGKWTFDEAKVKWDGNELKMKDKYGRKVKWDEGKLKIKDWNSKYKSEKGDDAKIKQEWDKIKWKDDEVKIEQGTDKTKLKQ